MIMNGAYSYIFDTRILLRHNHIFEDWVGAVEEERHVFFLNSVTREVKREEMFFIPNNMPGKEEQSGTRRKRDDCKSPNTDGSRSSPEAKRSD